MTEKTDMQALGERLRLLLSGDALLAKSDFARATIEQAIAALAARDAMSQSEFAARVLGAIHDYAVMKPEEDEDWESWYVAAFDLLATRVGDLFAARYAQADESRAADPAEELQGWSVTVERNGVRLLTIEKESVSDVENIGDFAPFVRDCAEHLLSFIGRDAQAESRAPTLWEAFEMGFSLRSAMLGHVNDGRDVGRLTTCEFWHPAMRDMHVGTNLNAGLTVGEAIVRLKNEVRRRLDVLAASPYREHAGEMEKRLHPDDVEWVVNDIAELGVKIGNQFFFLYKGYSLVYEDPIHDDGSPMHWRPVFKREFGECAHPINYDDPTRIGTVSLNDSEDWQPLPKSDASPSRECGERQLSDERILGEFLRRKVHVYDEDGNVRPLGDAILLATRTLLATKGEERQELQAEIDRLNAIINTPQSDDFLRAVSIEAEHQRQRYGSSHDAGKLPADWFWLVGYLGGKALHAHAADNIEKAEHHIITTAAACANWHRNMFGKTDMRPGIDGEAALAAKGE